MKHALAILSLAVVMASSPVQADDDKKSPATDQIERIEVYNKIPLVALKHKIEKAKVDFYDAYNEINDVKDFEIVCRRVKGTGSNFKTRVCEQYFFIQKRGELNRSLASNDINRVGIRGGEGELLKATEDKRKAALEHLNKLVQENPALQEKYQALASATAVYKERQLSEQ